jgi:hypothetical protein
LGVIWAHSGACPLRGTYRKPGKNPHAKRVLKRFLFYKKLMNAETPPCADLLRKIKDRPLMPAFIYPAAVKSGALIFQQGQ